ncbi:unnamed protein product [Brassica rapa]|uniref:Uncharacterized protein n=2 Tax=Brassica TaxID=3705 RepID=A0A8D9M758_BRACM|nr:unnamed protein product [Brassica napus]CAG7901297.1 unnamed protein product [Brassica rapa]
MQVLRGGNWCDVLPTYVSKRSCMHFGWRGTAACIETLSGRSII